MNYTKRWMAALGLTALTAFGSPASADDAKPGDELIVYTGTGLPTDFADALIEPFSKHIKEKYGVDIHVRTVPGAIPAEWAQLQTEWPNPTGDVFWLYNQQIRDGIKQNYWMPIQDKFTPEEWASFDEGAMKTLNTAGFSAPIEVTAWVLLAQNSLPEGAVTSIADLGKEEYAHRVTFDSALSVASGYNAIAAAATVLGDDWHKWFQNGQFNEDAARPAFELVGKWAANALTLTQGSGSIRPLLRRGEALISAWWWHNAIEELRAGTPVHIVEPKEGVMALVQSGPVISAKTKNPVGAVEWVKFVHSAEANDIAQKVGYVNKLPRKGESASPEWQEFTSKAKFVWIDDFRDTMLDPAYNEKVLDLYNRVVIQGQ
ncbi:extracellular solute-binding protein [Rhizobium binxianense]